MPYYQLYEMNHAFLRPMRWATKIGKDMLDNPLNPASHMPLARNMRAGMELFERLTRRYDKPEFGIEECIVAGHLCKIDEEISWRKPFCDLLHFKRRLPEGIEVKQPKLLIVAPMSGHYATLLRGTVESLVQHFDVFITDWADARMVPLSQGEFSLDDYMDYLIEIYEFLGHDIHVLAVCQPSVPVMATVAVLEEQGKKSPLSMTLMGGPIDTRVNMTEVNRLAEERGTEWFAHNVIMKVPFPNPGFMRNVYPGFLQLSGFMHMNLDRHVQAHHDFFVHLVKGDGDNAEKHREFYDEYLAVADLAAEYYLQTVDTVFVNHHLPRGEMRYRDRLVAPDKIRHTALFTVEGEMDDISGVGQTEAAHGLCCNLPEEKKRHYVQPKVGHYGVFNGSRFRREIVPGICEFIADNNGRKTS